MISFLHFSGNGKLLNAPSINWFLFRGWSFDENVLRMMNQLLPTLPFLHEIDTVYFLHPKYWPRHNWQLINLLCWSYGFPDCPPSSSSPIDTSLPVISISCSIYVVNFSLHLHNVRTVELHNVLPIPPILIPYHLIRQYGPYIPSVHLCFLPNNNFNLRRSAWLISFVQAPANVNIL